MTEPTKAPFIIGRLYMTGELTQLAGFATYEDADADLDRWCATYPGAFIDVYELNPETGEYEV